MSFAKRMAIIVRGGSKVDLSVLLKPLWSIECRNIFGWFKKLLDFLAVLPLRKRGFNFISLVDAIDYVLRGSIISVLTLI